MTHRVIIRYCLLWCLATTAACGPGLPTIVYDGPAPTEVGFPGSYDIPANTLPSLETPFVSAQRAAFLEYVGRTYASTTAGHAKAITALDRAVKHDPASASAWSALAQRLEAVDSFALARTALEQFLQLDPTNAEARASLALVSMRQAHHDRWVTQSPDTWPDVIEHPADGPTIRLTAVGDVTLGRAWPTEEAVLPPNNAEPLFANVAQLFHQADVAFGNLETVLADSGESSKCGRSPSNCYAFRAPTAYAHTLRQSGFSLLSMNNNHAGDFGAFGRSSTAEVLDEVGIAASGPSTNIATVTRRGVRIAMLAFSTGNGPFRVQDIPWAQRAVADADREYDIVIVSFHAGAEGASATHIPKTIERAFGENRGDVFAFARAVVDAGADLVLGHGPHVLRGMEVYRGRFIAYSLGNFSAWHNFNLRGPLGLSVILDLDIAPNGVVLGARLHPVVLAEPGIPNLDPDHQAIQLVRELSLEDLGDQLFDADGTYRRPAHPNVTSPQK